MTQTPGTPTSNTPAPSSGPARYQQIDQGQLDAWRRKGSRNMGFGIVWLVAGLLITLITMSSSSAHGGFYVIAFGPIIGGALQIISGYRTHRRGTNTPPSPAPRSTSSTTATASGASPSSTRTGGAAGSPTRPGPGASAWHPARSITRGMTRDELRRRLGEPTKHPITTADLHRDATVVGGLSRGTEAAWDKEFWLYQDTPPGHDTEITLDHTRVVEDITIRPHTDAPAPAPARALPAPRSESEAASSALDSPRPAAVPVTAEVDQAPAGHGTFRPSASPVSSAAPGVSSQSVRTLDPETPVAAESQPTSEPTSEPTPESESASGSLGTPRLLRRSAVRAESAGDLARARVLHRQVIDTGHTGVAPLSMLDLAGLVYRLNEVDAARALFQNAIDSSHPDAAPQAMYGLARLLQQLQSGGTGADVLLSQAIASKHPDAAPRAKHDLALLHKRRGNITVARQYLEHVIATGHTDAAPLAMNNLGLIHESAGELDEAAALYQRAADTGHPQQADMGRANLKRVETARARADTSYPMPTPPPRSTSPAAAPKTSPPAVESPRGSPAAADRQTYTYLLQVQTTSGNWGTLRDPHTGKVVGLDILTASRDELVVRAHSLLREHSDGKMTWRIVYFSGDRRNDKLTTRDACGAVVEESAVLQEL